MLDKNTKKVFEQLSRTWTSNVIAALLSDFQTGKATLPPDVILRGINMVEKENGTFTVGFVFAKEGC